MAGHRTWKEIRGAADSDPERRRRAEASRREAEGEQAAYEQSLAELRRARAFTQAQLAEALDVPQSQISRIEHQAELYISTLARYLEAMGGHLELVGVFGDQRVPLALGDLTHPTDKAEDTDVRDGEPLLTTTSQP
ncbi:MAG TPA: helix-turn-helix transcriptional regulator [Ktedonobacterales bacterium]|nr:helix-turn-helix transcriptional regulator [Ktedonobacterales bacterium]